MQKSNWREEIEIINEFRQDKPGISGAAVIGGALDVANKIKKVATPLIKKGLEKLKPGQIKGRVKPKSFVPTKKSKPDQIKGRVKPKSFVPTKKSDIKTEPKTEPKTKSNIKSPTSKTKNNSGLKRAAAAGVGLGVASTLLKKGGGAAGAVRKVGKAISGREKTDSQKRIIKTGGIKAARDMDGDGKLEKKRSGGEFQERLLYDLVHDYIISENFASDTEGANKIMLKLSDELMQEIYERTMTAAEKRKDTMLKKKYDDSDMKKNMQGQYGKEEGKKVYFATIRKQAMKKEEVESVEEKIKYDKSGSSMDYFLGADPKKTEYYKKNAKKKIKKEEVIPEAKYEAGASTYGKATIRNKRKFGTSGELPDIMTGKKITKDATRGELISKRREEHKAKRGVKEEVGITTHSMMMKDKAKKEAMLRMKERDAVAKKLRKEEVKRDEYGDPVGGPKITKKQLKKNLAANAPDEDHTNTTAEGYGSDRVGPALTMARAIDKVNPRPKPNSKRTRVSRALKMASIKKDEKIRKREENPYSADKRLKMVATSIRDRVKQKAKAMTAREDYIPEEGYDIARDMGRVKPSKDKKDGTTMPPSAEMKKTQKVNKGPSAFDRVKKKYGKAVMVVGKK